MNYIIGSVSNFNRLVHLCVITFSISLCDVSYARQPTIAPLLRCLGEEELNYHKKSYQGPNYLLNQYMLNTIAGANELILANNLEEKICRHSKLPPSVSLLRELLINGLKIFNIPIDPLGGHAQSMNIFWALEAELPITFFNYLSSLQSFASNPKCLENEIPHLTFFMERTKYLENDLESSQLLEPREKISDIFISIEKIDEIYKRCKNLRKIKLPLKMQ